MTGRCLQLTHRVLSLFTLALIDRLAVEMGMNADRELTYACNSHEDTLSTRALIYHQHQCLSFGCRLIVQEGKASH